MVQVDYSFLTEKVNGKSLSETVLSAIDVTTGMVATCVVQEKGPGDYAVNEIRRFVLEVGRSQGILQSDQEPAIRARCNLAASKAGMSVRLAPAYSHQSQGNVERWHRELQAVRVFKEVVVNNYEIDVEPGHPLLLGW